METWLIPRAFPRSFTGNASVIMAALLEKRKAAPMACNILKRTSSTPDWDRLQSAEPTVKIGEPEGVEPDPPEHVGEPAEVHEERGGDELVAEEDPDEVEEGRCRGAPCRWSGSAMRTMLVSSDAIRVPRVVLESATHLYCIPEAASSKDFSLSQRSHEDG